MNCAELRSFRRGCKALRSLEDNVRKELSMTHVFCFQAFVLRFNAREKHGGMLALLFLLFYVYVFVSCVFLPLGGARLFFFYSARGFSTKIP